MNINKFFMESKMNLKEKLNSKHFALRIIPIVFIGIMLLSSIFLSYSDDLFKIIVTITVYTCSLLWFGKKYDAPLIPFLLLVIGALSFGRDFSWMHVSIKGISLFVTEIAIGLSLVMLALKWKQRLVEWRSPLPRGLSIPMLVYFFLGGVYMAIGFLGNGMAASRDIVFCLYMVIFFITLSLLSDPPKFQFILRYLLPAVGVFLSMIIILYFVRIPHEKVFKQVTIELKMNNIGLYGGLIFIFGLSFFTFVKKRIRPLLALVIYLALLFIIMAEVRASWAGLLIIFIFLGILLKKEFRLFYLVFPLMVISIITIDYFGLSIRKDKLENIGERLTSMVKYQKNTMPAANIRWRLDIWGQTIKEIRKEPVFGWGYGIQIDYLVWKKRLSYLKSIGINTGILPPHNHLLAVTYKMGIIGLLLFLYINGRIFFFGLKHVKKLKSEYNRRFLIASLAGLLYWHGMAFFFDILESPPTSIFLWILLAAILATVHIDKSTVKIEQPLTNVF